MTRKEMIIIAALVNAGVLALLFMTAGSFDEEKESKSTLREEPQIAQVESPSPKNLSPKVSNEPIAIPLFEEKELIAIPEEESKVDISPKILEPQEEEYVSVTVKRGDFLQKIAKANGTTVEAIKKANRLKGEKIAVGQVLKIPVKTGTEKAKEEDKLAAVDTNAGTVEGAIYYTIKSGDNPWKLARQFHVPFDELLRLNRLDEEKAKNLKIGDKIRVR